MGRQIKEVCMVKETKGTLLNSIQYVYTIHQIYKHYPGFIKLLKSSTTEKSIIPFKNIDKYVSNKKTYQ